MMKISTAALAAKVDWEGGVLATLEYGITADEIEDPEIAALWRELEQAYERLGPIATEIRRRLKTVNA